MESLKRFGNSLLSRKFVLAVAGGTVAFGNAYWDWGLTVEEVMSVIVPLLAYIGVEGWRDVRALPVSK
jgi:hypothetical protein